MFKKLKDLLKPYPKIVSVDVCALALASILDEYIITKKYNPNKTIGDFINDLVQDKSSKISLDFINSMVNTTIITTERSI